MSLKFPGIFCVGSSMCQASLQGTLITLGSLIPVRLVCGLSKTRKAARLAVYEATMIIAKPAQTMPRTLALKLRGVPDINYLIV